MEASKELLDQLFPEPSQAEQLIGLATRLESNVVEDERGMTHIVFHLHGSVPIGKREGATKPFVKRGGHALTLIHVLQDQVDAQRAARERASKGRKRRVRKGGAK